MKDKLLNIEQPDDDLIYGVMISPADHEKILATIPEVLSDCKMIALHYNGLEVHVSEYLTEGQFSWLRHRPRVPA